MTPLDYVLIVLFIGALGILGMSTAEHADGRDRAVHATDRRARMRVRRRLRAFAFLVILALAIGAAPRAAHPTLPAVAGVTR